MTGTMPPPADPLANTFGINMTLIPVAMRDMRCWVNWMLVQREGKLTKVPCRPDGRRASTADPETWSSLAEVRNPSVPMIAGIGAVLDGEVGPDGLCLGIIDFNDLNRRRPGESDDSLMFERKQRASPRVRDVQARNGCVDVSSSKGGLHIVGWTRPLRQGINRDGIEIATQGRWFAVTAHSKGGNLIDISDLVDALAIELTLQPSVKFLLRHLGPTTLSAIHPDTGKISFRWIQDADAAVLQWITQHNLSGRNIYFSANQPQQGLTKKAKKTEIEGYRAVCADIDAKDGRGMADCLAIIAALPLKPSFVVMTGGGYQAVWRLQSALPAASDIMRRVEAIGRAIVAASGSDQVWNVDRILRLPGTINHPNARKRAAGRTRCLAQLLEPMTQ
jgi:hypothetical protein